jgi:hypothetical protein
MSKYSIKEPLRYSLTYLMAAGLCVTSLYPIATLAEDSMEMMCHAVADNDKRGDSEDMLVKIYSDGRAVEVGTGTGTKHMEAISFDLNGEKLYVVAEPAEDGSSDGSRFGTLDLNASSETWGQFLPIGNGLGTANGAEGPILLDDVDSLTFDYATQGIVYATLRREHTTPPQYDLLFQIHSYTGTLKSNAFGPGIDYVAVKVSDPEGKCLIKDNSGKAQDDYYDIDDIASDPQDGILYVVANTGNGVESVLAQLVVEKGVPTGEAVCIGPNVDDIESLDFEKNAQPDGSYRLYGTTGNGGHRKGDDPTAKSHIYLIDKKTGASTQLGKLKQPEQPNQDYEAVSCQPLPSSCLMYALHDEGVRDSQTITIDFVGNGIGAIKPLGPLYVEYDIEGLVVWSPTPNDGERGKLYGTSGSDQKKTKVRTPIGEPIADGAFYEINRDTGIVTFIGLTGFSEVSGLTLRQTDNTIWGWSRGGNRKQKSPVGPIIIAPATGAGQLPPGVTDNQFTFKEPDIQALAWSNDGQKLYASVPTDEGTDLWAYDYTTQNLEPVCTNVVKAEIEAMEMQANGLLLLGTHTNKDIGMVAYDPEICAVVATRTFRNVPEYYDIESIELPAAECGDRSWLYETSGDAEIELIEHDIIPGNVVDAVCIALGGCDGDIDVERDGDTVKVYAGEQVFVVRPAIFGGSNTRNGVRPDSNGCWLVNSDTDEEIPLAPVLSHEAELRGALAGFGKVKIGSCGLVTVTPNNGGQAFQCQISLEHVQPKGRTQISPATAKVAQISPIADRAPFMGKTDGIADYELTWSTGWKQFCYGR